MAAGAEAVGLPPAEAERIARATVAGAGALLDASDESAAALREAVTSPGGTTAAGLQALDEGRFVHLIAAAVEAARDRGRELGEA
jgi:pyrroline-5-carboxylate reductase